MVGAATATATSVTATINGQQQSVDYRRGEYFQEERAVANSTPQWVTITASATLGTTVSTPSTANNVFLAATPENLTYDEDGNLKVDGRWTYTWDAENRLKEVVANSNVPDGAKRKVQFTYDHMGRRASKTVYSYSGGSYINPVTTRYVYDGWRVVAELDASNNVLRSYGWGLDLSGSMEGAGGIGGLWAVKVHGGSPSDNFVAYDGNGNVTALVDGSTQVASGRYEYGPFGELVRSSGALAKVNPFRFSTKWQDEETELLYYGKRFYNSTTGRWLSRDPIEEDDSSNLYAFVANQPTLAVDTFGESGYYPGGSTPGSRGHHVTPMKILKTLPAGPGTEYLKKFVVDVKVPHWNDSPHRALSQAVSEFMDTWLRKRGLTRADLAKSADLAKEFTDAVYNQPKNTSIGAWLSRNLSNGSKITKASIIVGAAFAGYSAYAGSGELIESLQSYQRSAASGDSPMLDLDAVSAAIAVQNMTGDYFTTQYVLDALLQ